MATPPPISDEIEARAVLRRQIVTERSKAIQGEHNQWVFEVEPGASKEQIRQVIEKLYKVSVVRVTTMNVRGKHFSGRRKNAKGMQFTEGKRANWKKAIVHLKEGQRLPLA